MKVLHKKIDSTAFKISVKNQRGAEIGHGYLYLIKNDLHQRPYGLMEDIFVNKQNRGKGSGSQIVKYIVNLAKKQNCYKLIAASRYSRKKVHQFYQKLGFSDHGKNSDWIYNFLN